jgi:hypothetical protein
MERGYFPEVADQNLIRFGPSLDETWRRSLFAHEAICQNRSPERAIERSCAMIDVPPRREGCTMPKSPAITALDVIGLSVWLYMVRVR